MTKRRQLLIKGKPSLNIRRLRPAHQEARPAQEELLHVNPKDRKKRGLRVPKTATLGRQDDRAIHQQDNNSRQEARPSENDAHRNDARPAQNSGAWKRHTIIGAAEGTFQKTGFVPTLAVRIHSESDIQQLLKDAHVFNTAATGSNSQILGPQTGRMTTIVISTTSTMNTIFSTRDIQGCASH